MVVCPTSLNSLYFLHYLLWHRFLIIVFPKTIRKSSVLTSLCTFFIFLFSLSSSTKKVQKADAIAWEKGRHMKNMEEILRKLFASFHWHKTDYFRLDQKREERGGYVEGGWTARGWFIKSGKETRFSYVHRWKRRNHMSSSSYDRWMGSDAWFRHKEIRFREGTYGRVD